MSTSGSLSSSRSQTAKVPGWRRHPVLTWWLPQLPLARVAWVRTFVAVVAAFDALFLLSSPRSRAGTPEFYDPVVLAQALGLPPPTEVAAHLVLASIILGLVGVAVGGRSGSAAAVQHLGGVVLALAYGTWCLWGMSFGYVAHDHMAIMVAVLLLPTAGTCRYREPGRSSAAGWALRMIQVFTVLTYTGSVLVKAVMNGWDLVRWGQSGTLVWAFLRRPNPVNELLVEQGALLRLAQWGALLLELAAPVVFVVRQRWRWLVVAVFLGFHATTFALLGIHFLPTVVCWSAFLPWEQWLRTRADRAGRPQGPL